PSVMQVSVLLYVLSKYSLTYQLWQYQCYWYAHTIWEALKRLFMGAGRPPRLGGALSVGGRIFQRQRVLRRYVCSIAWSGRCLRMWWRRGGRGRRRRSTR
ncbi:hypothetical protein EDD22DRAFT_789252, partial [Suillus occidentalis]